MLLHEAPLCVELHDVAPATWQDCNRILQMVDAVGDIPVTLLVVPDFHRSGRVSRDAVFLRAIDQRVARGDEVSLHGLVHLDEGPAPRTPAEWFRRRVRTLSEGEFAALDADAAEERIGRGYAELAAAGWTVSGFVPPAWLAGREARVALTRFPFAYVALRGAFHRLPDWAVLPTTTLSYAAFTRVRRALSRPVLQWQSRRAAPARTLRLALHPVDGRHAHVLAHWQSMLTCALAHRVAMTASGIVTAFLPADAAMAAARHSAAEGGSSRPARADVASRP